MSRRPFDHDASRAGIAILQLSPIFINSNSRCAPAAPRCSPDCAPRSPLFLFSEARENFGEPLASALAGDALDEVERRPFSGGRDAATLILSAIRLSIFPRRSSDGIL
jgi:hypothetical protein